MTENVVNLREREAPGRKPGQLNEYAVYKQEDGTAKLLYLGTVEAGTHKQAAVALAKGPGEYTIVAKKNMHGVELVQELVAR